MSTESMPIRNTPGPLRRLARKAVSIAASAALALSLVPAVALTQQAESAEAATSSSASSVQVTEPAKEGGSYDVDVAAPIVNWGGDTEKQLGDRFMTEGRFTLGVTEGGKVAEVAGNSASENRSKGKNMDWNVLFNKKLATSGHKSVAGKITDAEHYTIVTFGCAVYDFATSKSKYKDVANERDKAREERFDAKPFRMLVWVESVKQDGKTLSDVSESRLQLREDGGKYTKGYEAYTKPECPGFYTSSYPNGARKEIDIEGDDAVWACSFLTTKASKAADQQYLLMNSIPLQYTRVGKHLVYSSSMQSGGNNRGTGNGGAGETGADGSPFSLHRMSFFQDAGGDGTSKSYKEWSPFRANHGTEDSTKEANKTFKLTATVNAASTGLRSAPTYKSKDAYNKGANPQHYDYSWNQFYVLNLKHAYGVNVSLDLDGGALADTSATARALTSADGKALANDTEVIVPNPTKKNARFLGWALKKSTGRTSLTDTTFPKVTKHNKGAKKDISQVTGAVYKKGLKEAASGELKIKVHNGQMFCTPDSSDGANSRDDDADFGQVVRERATLKLVAVWSDTTPPNPEPPTPVTKSYTIRYIVNGEEYSNETVDDGDSYTLASYDPGEGETFDGWYTSGDYTGSTTSPGTSKQATADVTYYGKTKMQAKPTYSVTYYIDGGMWNSYDVDPGSSYTLPSPSASGVTFDGWYAAPSKTGKVAVGAEKTMPTANVSWYGYTSKPAPTVTGGHVEYFVDGKQVADYKTNFNSDYTYNTQWNTVAATYTGSKYQNPYTRYVCSVCGYSSLYTFTHYYCSTCGKCTSTLHDHCSHPGCDYYSSYRLAHNAAHYHCPNYGCVWYADKCWDSYPGNVTHYKCNRCGLCSSTKHYHCTFKDCAYYKNNSLSSSTTHVHASNAPNGAILKAGTSYYCLDHDVQMTSTSSYFSTQGSRSHTTAAGGTAAGSHTPKPYWCKTCDKVIDSSSCPNGDVTHSSSKTSISTSGSGKNKKWKCNKCGVSKASSFTHYYCKDCDKCKDSACSKTKNTHTVVSNDNCSDSHQPAITYSADSYYSTGSNYVYQCPICKKTSSSPFTHYGVAGYSNSCSTSPYANWCVAHDIQMTSSNSYYCYGPYEGTGSGHHCKTTTCTSDACAKKGTKNLQACGGPHIAPTATSAQYVNLGASVSPVDTGGVDGNSWNSCEEREYGGPSTAVNVGSGDVTTTSKNGSNSAYGRVGNPSGTPEGSTRSDWYTSPTYETKASSSYTPSQIKSGVNLYAYTTENHAIKYVVNNRQWGSTETAAQGDDITVKDYPTPEGYVFTGWWKNDDSMSGDPDMPPGSTDTATGSITYYGRLMPVSHDVTYNVYNPDGTLRDSWSGKYEHGSSYKVEDYAVPAGYSFDGWYTSYDAADNKGAGDKVYAFSSATCMGDTVYSAVLSEKADYATIRYVVDGAEMEDWQQTLAAGTEYELHAFEREGYTFDGWHKRADLADDALAPESTQVSGTEDVTYYGETNRIIEYTTIKYYVDGEAYGDTETYERGEGYTVREAPVKEGYTFLGWYSPSDGDVNYTGGAVTEPGSAQTAEGDVTYTGRFRKDAVYHNVYYYIDGEAWSSQEEIEEGTAYTLPTPYAATEEGITFDGWYKIGKLDPTTGLTGDTTPCGAEVTMGTEDEYWAAETRGDECTIRYVVDGVALDGTDGTDDLTQTVERGTYFDMSAMPAPMRGHYLDGWYTDDTYTAHPNGDEWDPEDMYVYCDGDATYYGRNVPIHHTVHYIVNGEETHKDPSALEDCDYNPAYDRSSDSFGGELSKWYTDEGCSSEAGDTIHVGTEDVYLYAYTKHEVDYVVDGAGVPELGVSGVAYGTSLTLPTYAESRPGWHFEGTWHDDASLSGSGRAVGAEVKVTGDKTYYGSTARNRYTVRYVVDGTERPALAQTVTFEDGYTLASDANLANRWFEGYWYSDAGYTQGKSDAGSSKNLSEPGDVTWYGRTYENTPVARYYVDDQLVSTYKVAFPDNADLEDVAWTTGTAELSGRYNREAKTVYTCSKCGESRSTAFEHYWCPICGKCTETQHLTGSAASDTFASPNWPSQYGNNASTSKKISFPGAVSVKVTVSDDCVTEGGGYDYFTITDASGNAVAGGSSDAGGIVLRGTTSSSWTKSFTLSGSEFTAAFKSDTSSTYKGAQLTFTPVYPAGTVVHEGTSQAAGGTFASPNWPSYYGNSQSTEKEFSFPGATSISFSVDSSAYTEQNYDWFTVYDKSGNEVAGGRNNAGGITLQGSSFTKTFTVSGDYAKVAFRSDGSNTYVGAQLTLTPAYGGNTVTKKSYTAISGELGSGQVSVTSAYGASCGDPIGRYSYTGRLGAWQVKDADGNLSAAAGSYGLAQLNRGLDFYAYVAKESDVKFVVNGEEVGTSTVPAGDTIPASDLDKVDKEVDKRFPGGELTDWSTDPEGRDVIDPSTWVPEQDTTLYAHTLHDVLVTMDPGTGGEQTFTYGELLGKKGKEGKVRYGTSVDLSVLKTAAVSAKLTKSGCEDWLTRDEDNGLERGKLYNDTGFGSEATSVTAIGTPRVYGYNAAYVTLDATDASKRLDASETLADGTAGRYQLYSEKVDKDSYSSAPETTIQAEIEKVTKADGSAKFPAANGHRNLYRYGDTYTVDELAPVYWLNQSPANAPGYTGGDSPQMLARRALCVTSGAAKLPAAYLVANPGKGDSLVTSVEVTGAVTVYKAYAQKAFDGVIGG